MVKDMTQGAPGKILWSFSLPLLFSVIFQQLYSIVDSVVAGKFVGVGALAAVGASYPITMIFIAIATGANIGSSVIISQYFGAKKYEDMKTAVYTSILSVVALSLILTVAGTVYCNPLMRMLDTPADVFGDGALYLRIYIWGLLFLFLYNICTGVFTALGDSRTPLYFLIGSSVSNIVFDLIFVISFRMGVAGVAWATFLCQGVASLLAILTLIRRLRKIKTSQAFPVYSFRMLGRISIVAVPSILQQSFISIGNLFVQRVHGNGFLLCSGKAEYLRDNIFYDYGQRPVQFHSSKYGSDEKRTGAERVPGGSTYDSPDLCSVFYRLLCIQPGDDTGFSVQQRGRISGHSGRNPVFEDCISILFCDFFEINGGRRPARGRSDGAFYGSHVLRSYSQSGPFLCHGSGVFHGQYRYLAVLADRLGNRNRIVPGLLSEWYLETENADTGERGNSCG